MSLKQAVKAMLAYREFNADGWFYSQFYAPDKSVLLCCRDENYRTIQGLFSHHPDGTIDFVLALSVLTDYFNAIVTIIGLPVRFVRAKHYNDRNVDYIFHTPWGEYIIKDRQKMSDWIPVQRLLAPPV